MVSLQENAMNMLQGPGKPLIAALIYHLHSKFSIIIYLAQISDFSSSSLNDWTCLIPILITLPGWAKVALGWFMYSSCQGKNSNDVMLNPFGGQLRAIGIGVLADSEIFYVLMRDKNSCLKWLPITPRSCNNNTTDSDINLKYPGSPKTL